MNGREPDTGSLKDRFWSGFDRWMKVFVVLVIPAGLWAMNSVHSNMRLQLEAYVQAEISKLPPQEFQKKVDRMATQIDKIADDMSALKERTGTIEGRLGVILDDD